MINEMLLGFVTGILNKFIGEYFENIDASQLTGSLFGGGVTLNDVSLRRTIFEGLGLPFHVVGGKCGTLEVKYSLRKLYSEPVVVNIKDLHVLIIPTRNVKYDAEAEKSALLEEKLRQLKVFETIKHHIKHANNSAGNKQDSPAVGLQEASYLDMWVWQVVRNILFQVESVHIRFEDDVTNKAEPFAVGLTLQSLTVLTTDAAWKGQYVKDYAPETMYKLVKLDDLAIYWNPAPTAMYKGIEDKKLLFTRLAVIPKKRDSGFKFLFSPMSLEIKVQITPFPHVIQIPFSKPKLSLETSRDDLMLSVSDKQFRDIFMFLDTIDQLVTSHKYRKHRPIKPYKGNYKEWWHFAFTCVMENIQRRRNNFRWAHIAEHRDKCRQYFKAYYKMKVEKKSGAAVDSVLSALEEELDLLNLILVRKQVDMVRSRVNSGPPAEAQQADTTSSWLSSWFYSSAPPPVQSAPSRVSVTGGELSRDEKDELKIAVGFVKNIDVHNYPDNYVDVEASVLLNELRLKIHRTVNRQRETVLEAALDRVGFAFRTRPIGQGVQLELKMGRIEAYGGDFPRGAIDDAFSIPQLVTTANPGITDYFVKVAYEKSPLDSEVDHRLSVEGLALQFTYHADAIERLVDCLTIPKATDEKVVGSIPATTILNRIMKFKASSTGKLLRMMENKGKLELSACLVAPYFVIPVDMSKKERSHFVVMNLGEINVFGTIVGGTICQNGLCSELLT